MIDNNFKNNLRQKLGKYYFNYYIKKKYDLFWVPGSSAKKLLNFYGIKNSKIFINLYCFNEKIFKSTKFILNRDNNFVFLGQAVLRKGFDIIIKAFKKINDQNKSSKLIIVTNTPKKLIPNYNYLKENNNIVFEFNKNPDEVARILNKNKYFVLISREDHWPLAFLESVACGCICVVSSKIGNLKELNDNSNSIVVNKLDYNEVYKKIFLLLNIDKEKKIKIHQNNLEISKKFRIISSVKIFLKIINFVPK